MQTTANVTEAKRVRAAPTFSSTEVEKWDLLLRAYLKRDEAEWVLDQRPPTPDMEEAASLLGPDGEQTEEWKQFWKDNKERGLGRMASRTLQSWKGAKDTTVQCWW